MIKLALSTPAYGDRIVANQAGMWLEIGQALNEFGDSIQLAGLITVDTCGVDRARNYLIAHAMQLNADWLLMVDADTWAGGRDLLRMIIACAARGATIAAAPVWRRGMTDNTLNIYRREDSKLVPYSELMLQTSPSIFEVEAAGAAVMAIDLHKIGDEIFKFTDEQSEDLYLCSRVRAVGNKIYVDKRVSTGHLGKTPTMLFPS